MVVIWNANLKAEYWDANLDIWLESFEGNVWFVPGTDVEAHWNWEKDEEINLPIDM